MIDYKIIDNELYIDNTNVCDLAKQYGTPLYVISYTKLKQNIEAFKKHFQDKYENVKVHYASKANLSLGLARIMQANDFGLDVVNGGELYVAKEAGVNLKNIEFNGNNKTYEEIEFGITEEIGYFVVDNEYELNLIQEIAKKHDKKQDILFRITPEISGGAHKHINTGQKNSKFGIPITENIFINVFKRALEMPNVTIKGIHFHLGSQLHENDPYLKAIDVVSKIAKQLQELFNYNLEVLNIGGGFGIQYTDADNPPELDFYFEPIMEKITKVFKELNYQERPKIVVEPGRYLIGEAGITLYEVGSITDIPNIRTYVGVNGGMADNIRPAMYQAKYFAMLANKAGETPQETVTIAGNCCESGDIIIEDIKIPKIASHDILCVFATGAYGYSMASNYNKNRIPGTVLVENNKVQQLVKPQSFEQLIENDCDIEL